MSGSLVSTAVAEQSEPAAAVATQETPAATEPKRQRGARAKGEPRPKKNRPQLTDEEKEARRADRRAKIRQKRRDEKHDMKMSLPDEELELKAEVRTEVRDELLEDVMFRLDEHSAYADWDDETTTYVREVLTRTANNITGALESVDRGDKRWDEIREEVRQYRLRQAADLEDVLGPDEFADFADGMSFTRFASDEQWVRGRL